MAPCLYIREAAPRVMVANNYNTRESIYAGRVNPFLKQDLIDTSTWYRNSSTNTSRSTSVNTSTSTSTSVNTTITLAQLEKVMANKNNLSVRILNNDTAYIAIDSGSIANNSIHTIMPISITDTNNPWRQDVVIVVSYTNNSNLTWNYVVFTMDGAILDGGTMSANINLIKSSVLAHDSNTPTVITPVYTTTATTPVVTTTVAPTTPLSFKINYSLGTQNANGSYNLDSATCNTNGSVDVLWIEQQTANNTFGLGIEINNTFGNQTYKVNKGDKLCCRVSTLKGAYQKAGGCEVVK